MRRLHINLLALVAMIISLSPAQAQSVNFGGTTFNNDIIGWYDLYNLSFTSHNYGTARSMAMGNAFTALGADMVSTSLNPAGIGMYVDSDVSFTPMMQFTKSPTKGGDPYYANVPKRSQTFDDHTERVAMGSMGGIFSVYKGAGAVTNINFGVAYNRIADYNEDYLVAKHNNSANNSLANFFCTLSNVDGLLTDNEGKMAFGDPYYWGATLAYKNGLTNKDAQGWFIDRIADNAIIDQYSSVSTRGSLGEYDITVGFNFLDRIYLGASLGIQSLDYKRETYYGEDYLYSEGQAPSGDDMPYQLQYMNYMQTTRIEGSGFNFKIGVTARPFDWLRIGVAYHTPTFYNVAMRYNSEMWSETFSAGNNPDGYDIDKDGYMADYVESPIWEDSGPYSWEYRSPSRLLTGVALTLGKRVILSADYERSWYQTIRLEDAPIDDLDVVYRDNFKEVFKGSNTLRVGVEGYVLPFLALRAGYIWNGSTLKQEYKDAIVSHPVPTKQTFITAGVGIKFSPTIYLDLAYQYGNTTYTTLQTFFAVENATAETNDLIDIQSARFSTSTKRHSAVLTLGFRF